MKEVIWDISGKPRWNWEKSGGIYVYGLSGVSKKDIENAINLAKEALEELGLPLVVMSGNKHRKGDLPIIEKLLRESLREGGCIDYDLFKDKIYELKEEEDKLPYGIIILVDDYYEFCHKPNEREQPVYGYGTCDGIAIIRKSYIPTVTKHEIGHIVGLNHHNNCVMSYVPSSKHFCEKCKEKIKEIWEL